MKTGLPSATPRGMSFSEILVSVCIVGILTMISIPAFMSNFGSSQTTVATNLLETVNSAVHRFNEGNYELNITPSANDTTASVELSVVRTLQYRNPLFPKPGSPYVYANWNPVPSSNTSDYRLQWKGRLFILLAPGTAGSGLKVDFKGGDLTTPYVFPANFQMAGS